MAFPTSILRAPVRGLHGQIADASNVELVSRVCQTANIAPGLAVRYTGPPDDAVQFGAHATGMMGIAILDTTREVNGVANNPYVVGEAVSVLKKGTIWLTVAAASPNTDATADTTSGVIGTTAADATHIRVGTWETATGTDGLARLRANLP